MNVEKIKNYLKNSQGVLLLFVAVLLFSFLPYIIGIIWPHHQDTGVIIVPGSFFALLVFSAIIFFFGVYVAWKVYEADFWGIDEHFNKAGSYFDNLSSFQKICVIYIPFFLLLAFYCFSLLVAVLILAV